MCVCVHFIRFFDRFNWTLFPFCHVTLLVKSKVQFIFIYVFMFIALLLLILNCLVCVCVRMFFLYSHIRKSRRGHTNKRVHWLNVNAYTMTHILVLAPLRPNPSQNGKWAQNKTHVKHPHNKKLQNKSGSEWKESPTLKEKSKPKRAKNKIS